jgi:hypothetical protein
MIRVECAVRGSVGGKPPSGRRGLCSDNFVAGVPFSVATPIPNGLDVKTDDGPSA